MEYRIITKGKSDGEQSEKEIDLTPFIGDTVLQLNYKGLTELPTQLIKCEEFKHVTNLYLKRNKLKMLPDGINVLQNLVVLYLHSNELTSLPESIGDLRKLESLDVGANFLTALPDSIGCLCNLTSLKLAYNSVTHLPKSIGELQQLVTLEAMNNRLKNLPLELFNCEKLEMLLIDSNQLTFIPRQICKLSCLNQLSATGNKLIMLPFGFGRNINLKSVFVDCNCHLSVLPIDVSMKQVGFYRCGSLPLSRVSDSILSNICHVTIQHTETAKKMLPLPYEIRTQGNLTNMCVPSLLELSLRCTYMELYCNSSRNEDPDEIPRMFVPLLDTPTAWCYRCETAVFTMAFPIIFQSRIDGEGVYILALCCSVACLRQSTFSTNLPLVYPSMENLSLAVAVFVQ